MKRSAIRLCRLLFLLVSAVFLSFSNAFASGYHGGYLSYKLVPNDSADIILVLYRSCTGITLNANPAVVLTQSATTVNITLNRLSITGVTDLCPTTKDLCNGGTNINVGFERHYYSKRVSLASFNSNSEIKISWSDCCYDGVFASFTGGNDYLESYFMKGVGINEGPEFCYELPLIFTTGIPNYYNARTLNQNNDSIVYAMTSGLIGPGSNVTYTGGFSGAKPFPYSGFSAFALQFDNKTGQLKAGASDWITPTGANSYYLLSYTVSRYRSGVKIGQTLVSHTLCIISNGGNNSTPNLFTSSGSYKVCAGSSICFDVYSSDVNSGDSTSIVWDRTISGATFQTNGLKNEKGVFCWTPSANDVRTEPYYITFRGTDNSCPKRSSIVKVIAIEVKAAANQINANEVSGYNPCTGKVNFQATVTSGSGTCQYQWAGTGGMFSTDSSFSHTYSSTGKHYYSIRISSLQSCGDFIKNDSVVVPLHIPLSVSINGKTDTIACSNTPLLLTAAYIGGRLPYSYSWNGSALSSNGTYTFQSSQPGTVYLLMTDSFGCSKTAQISVGIRNLPSVSILIPDTAVCYNSPVLSLSGHPSGGNWSSTSTCLNGSSFTPKLSCAGPNRIVYRYTDVYGCAGSDTLSLTILNSIQSQTGSYSPLCYNASPLQLNGTPSNGTWSGNGIIGDKFYPAVAGTGTHAIFYQAAGGCGTQASTYINVLYSAQISFTNPSYVFCEASNQAFLLANPSGGIWSGNSVQSNGTFNPSAAGTGNHFETYTYTYTNGCVTTDSVLIKVEQLPVVNAGSDRKTCINNGDITLSGYPAGGVWSGTSVTGNKFNTGIAAGAYKIMYAYTAQACTNKDSMLVNVLAADFSSMSVLGNAPFTVNFSNNSSAGFSGFEWNFGDSLSGSNNTSVAFTPSHTYQQQGSYTVKLTAFNQDGNCSTSRTKSSYINVNPNGVSNAAGKSELLVYPNPSNAGFIRVNWLSSENGNYQIHIYDLTGREVKLMEAYTNSEQLISGFSRGIYLLKVESNSGLTDTKKIVVQ
ncbi:MAG: T9SS type A sorting domain-containing protein [Bacteroidia bacterium]|nr:T9SS type A sorting domain-containing protein [Bacteroidia bacterium]